MPPQMQNASMTRVEQSFKQLASAAQALNSASDDLSKVVRLLDASLKKLALGITAWVEVSGTSDETQYWTSEIGYAMIDGKWGLALREITGFQLDQDESEQTWPYNDAPRALRTAAVDKIPDLLEKMLQRTEETTKELTAKIEQASELTALVSGLVPNTPPATPQQWHRPSAGSLPSDSHSRSAQVEGQGGPAAANGRFRETNALPAERPEAATAANPVPAAAPATTPFVRFRETESLPVERIAGDRPAVAPAAAPRPLPAERSV